MKNSIIQLIGLYLTLVGYHMWPSPWVKAAALTSALIWARDWLMASEERK